MTLYLTLSLVGLVVLRLAWRRLILSKAKNPSVAGHARISRLLAKLVCFYEYEGDDFFCCDGAPPDIAQMRKTSFYKLAEKLSGMALNTINLGAQLETGVSDL